MNGGRILVLICFLLPGLLIGDTIRLRNGQVLTGKIISQTSTQVRIRTANGIRSVPKQSIRRIKFGTGDLARQKAEAERKARLEREKQNREAERRKRELEEQAAAAERAIAIEEPTLDWSAIGRSMLLPGLGQRYRNRRGAGFWTAGFGLALAGAAAHARVADVNAGQLAAIDMRRNQLWWFNRARGGSKGRSYLQLLLEQNGNRARQRTNAAIGTSRSFGYFAASIYVANLIDVALFRPDESTAALYVSFGVEANWLTYRVRF